MLLIDQISKGPTGFQRTGGATMGKGDEEVFATQTGPDWHEESIMAVLIDMMGANQSKPRSDFTLGSLIASRPALAA